MPGTALPKTVSEQFDLSFGIFARRGEKYSCYPSVLKFVLPAGGVCGAATHAVGGDAGYGLLQLIVPTGYLKMPYNEKATCTLEISKCRLLFFWECMVGIYAYASAGWLRAKNACVRTACTLHRLKSLYRLQVGSAVQPRMRLIGMQATACCVPLNVQAAFEPFCGFEKQPALFQVARGGLRGALRRDWGCLNRNCVRTAHTLRRDWRFCAGYGLLDSFTVK